MRSSSCCTARDRRAHPSLLTGGNPVFRVYDIDPDTYEVMDFTPYYSKFPLSPDRPALADLSISMNSQQDGAIVRSRSRLETLLLSSGKLRLLPRPSHRRARQPRRQVLASGHRGYGARRVRLTHLSSFVALLTCARLSRRSVFQLFNTRLSRGGKVENCSGHICKNNTICMLRSMRSESNCVSRSALGRSDST